jgi:hypothetical protein
MGWFSFDGNKKAKKIHRCSGRRWKTKFLGQSKPISGLSRRPQVRVTNPNNGGEDATVAHVVSV